MKYFPEKFIFTFNAHRINTFYRYTISTQRSDKIRIHYCRKILRIKLDKENV